MADLTITQASLGDVADIAPLFDAYRQFYEQSPDPGLALRYLTERMSDKDCVIFVARDGSGSAVGFTLLYPTFCSVLARRAFILYDLFVDPDSRRMQVGERLLKTAQDYARDCSAVWLRLETENVNKRAQALYNKMGWEKETSFFAYFFHLEGDGSAGG